MASSGFVFSRPRRDSIRVSRNKMIAHPTLERGNSHDYTDVIKKLLPFVEEVWHEIENYHRPLVSQMAKPTGGLDPRFCAKTSSRVQRFAARRVR
jgi:hypothetical protein